MMGRKTGSALSAYQKSASVGAIREGSARGPVAGGISTPSSLLVSLLQYTGQGSHERSIPDPTPRGHARRLAHHAPPPAASRGGARQPRDPVPRDGLEPLQRRRPRAHQPG